MRVLKEVSRQELFTEITCSIYIILHQRMFLKTTIEDIEKFAFIGKSICTKEKNPPSLHYLGSSKETFQDLG